MKYLTVLEVMDEGDYWTRRNRDLLAEKRPLLKHYYHWNGSRKLSNHLLEDRKNDSRKDAKIAKMDENSIGKEIVDAAIAVHRELGPGLLETVYEVVLLDEIRKRGFRAERQVPIAIVCRGVRFDEGFRADIIVESKVIIELKSVERITNAHKKQLLTYLKLTGMKLGYLLNFGEDVMKRGITRTVNGMPE